MPPATAAARQRLSLNISISALVVLAAAVSAISVGDPDGVWVRVGMILMITSAAMWLPWQASTIAVVTVWLVPNLLRLAVDEEPLFGPAMLAELPGLAGLAVAAALSRKHLHALEEENAFLSAVVNDLTETDEETGVTVDKLLPEAIEAELVRARRFERQFALMFVGVDELTQRFDYRDEQELRTALKATAQILRNTRTHVDRVFRRGAEGFALLLPECGPRDITGLVRRLSRAAKSASPPQGEPGGPLPIHFGVTFFPQCATTVEDLLKRAEVALRLGEKSPSRLRMDGAEAVAMPAPELLRRPEPQQVAWSPALEAEAVPRIVAVERSAAPTEVAPTGTDVGREPEAAAREGILAGMALNDPVASDLNNAVSDLLKHLDETLELIRTMKSEAAA